MGDVLSVACLLDDAGIWGGVKVVLEQANALAKRGHHVVVLCKGPRPDWMGVHTEFTRVATFNAGTIPQSDVVIATYWTTIEAAVQADRGQVLHYCQGFEWTFPHNTKDHPAILTAYALDLPAMVVSEHLRAELRRRFGRESKVVSPAVTPGFSPSWRRGPRKEPRIVVIGPYENVWKGAHTALLAVKALRDRGVPCRLVRISQLPLSDAERAVVPADEYYQGVRPAKVAALLRRADLLLAPSWDQEGFGLPVLEAMASGLPVVASDIPAFQSWTAGAAPLVPFDDPAVLAATARDLLADRAAWKRQRRAGLELAARYQQSVIADHAEAALTWAASGSWRRPSGSDPADSS